MNKLREHGETTATQNTATSRAGNSSCQQKQHHMNKLHEHTETPAIKDRLHLAQKTRHDNKCNYMNTTKLLHTQTPELG